ncbi:hypothetical protein WDU94_006682 [Cyamophila willieti]
MLGRTSCSWRGVRYQDGISVIKKNNSSKVKQASSKSETKEIGNVHGHSVVDSSMIHQNQMENYENPSVIVTSSTVNLLPVDGDKNTHIVMENDEVDFGSLDNSKNIHPSDVNLSHAENEENTYSSVGVITECRNSVIVGNSEVEAHNTSESNVGKYDDSQKILENIGRNSCVLETVSPDADNDNTLVFNAGAVVSPGVPTDSEQMMKPDDDVVNNGESNRNLLDFQYGDDLSPYVPESNNPVIQPSCPSNSADDVTVPNTYQTLPDKDSVLSACQFCGKSYKCVNKHIAGAHPDEHRQMITNKYGTKDSPDSNKTRIEHEQREVERAVDEWSRRDWNGMDLELLNKNVDEFQKFLRDVVHRLPGPKHPAVKYYEIRKNKNNVESSQNSRYKDSSNPQRKTKKDRKKRKESYIYESIQFQYFNCRKKAVRKVIGNDTRSCPISMNTIVEHYQSTLGQENSMTDHLDFLDNNDQSEWDNISQEEVDWAVKNMNMDSSSGPDGVLTRAIRIKGINLILTKIFNRMVVLGKVVPCLKEARTVLIDKGGQVSEVKNWRPITILPIVRRTFEKILEKRLRDFAMINPNQRGFISLPGCSINIAIVEKALDRAKVDKSDLACIFLDINQAYNNVGHSQVKKSLDRTKAPILLKNIIMDCQMSNRTHFEVGVDKSTGVVIKKGLMQGAPLSPLLYNIATNHVMEEITEEGLVNSMGVKVVDDEKLVALAFADDICLLCKSLEAAETIYALIKARLSELGMDLNPTKTQGIVLVKGNASPNEFTLDNIIIKPASNVKSVKYLGTSLTDQIVLEKETTIADLNEKINKITKSPYLKCDQKISILNTYIWPMLTFKLQNTPIDRWSIPFVDDLDKMVRSAIKQILDLPKDIPDAALYSAKNCRGLQTFRFSWEILIQRLNLFVNLQKQDGIIRRIIDLDGEISKCLTTLNISDSGNVDAKKIREELRMAEFERWEDMKMKGAGVCLFKEYKAHNKWLTTKEGLTTSEFTEIIKMNTNCAAVRAIPGRSRDGTQCRRCPGIENKPHETLAHVLGSCPFGNLAIINRHNTVRSLIAKELGKQYEVYEEVSGLADDGSTRRIDIIAIDRKKERRIIVDPTVRFERDANQPQDVNEEKRNIYLPTTTYYKEKYNLKEIDVRGLLIGSRGTITSAFKNFATEFNISESCLKNISQSVVRASIIILRNHIYGN